ncbi:MAG: type III-A CRISPR-associated RAMP protein Csm4 [Bacteroidetes bacterium]|nr:type III-A CRISPR-associated RAMP protein Csm4 [Bacteroidota bacterium]
MKNKPFKLYKLSFSAPLHISNEREDYSTGTALIHSDTIYAAIFFAWNQLGKTEWIPTSNSNEVGFAMSSLFPFYEDIYFLPRPQYTPEISYATISDTSLKKKIKKTTWVDTTIAGNLLNDEEPKYYKKENFNGQFWASKNLPAESIISSNIMPRSSVSRMQNEDTKIFYIERYFFNSKAGLYFLIEFENEEMEKRFNSGLKLVADEGIGTDRNIGHGKFTFESRTPFDIEFKAQKGLSMNLGLFLPDSSNKIQEMLNHSAAGYELIKRGGWLSEPYQTWRKKSVYMFKEGSVFKKMYNDNIHSNGNMVDIRPLEVPTHIQHPVWRCGNTLFINF